MRITTVTNRKRLTNQEIKKALHEEGPLHIKEFKYEGESIRELILAFGEYSFKYSTYDKNGSKMCAPGKNRSFCDLYCWIIGIRPNATVRTVKQEVAKLIIEGEIHPSDCSQINRGVYFFAGYQISRNQGKDSYKQRLSKFTEFGCNAGEFYEIT